MLVRRNWFSNATICAAGLENASAKAWAVSVHGSHSLGYNMAADIYLIAFWSFQSDLIPKVTSFGFHQWFPQVLPFAHSWNWKKHRCFTKRGVEALCAFCNCRWLLPSSGFAWDLLEHCKGLLPGLSGNTCFGGRQQDVFRNHEEIVIITRSKSWEKRFSSWVSGNGWHCCCPLSCFAINARGKSICWELHSQKNSKIPK